ncbi:hypothetical protein GCM10010954_24130 [Halobacillus andaensis]|uniref:Uncharacterized protein n=1 Tax=Halobacillus andaensis TaxID=1176239 RepID=A0A917EWA4_HALAA|nr:hypothetical protein [Halobacillus andaensis]MBP2005998.1 hypothetical protein [Halobacillus andaensis]GGF24410.1 hypothetical protein GCM10010954_24130 [Halobacillus andaensis]
MQKLIAALLVSITFIIAGCSSGEDISLASLKEDHPEAFGKPVEDSLTKEEQESLGLPTELPFNLEDVEASAVEHEVEVNYVSTDADQLTVTTVYNPENNLQESDTRMTLDSGAIAGVTEREASVFFEWYDDEQNVIYQMAYSPMDEENRLEDALDIANSI